MCVYLCVRVRACVHACVSVRAGVYVCLCVCIISYKLLYRNQEARGRHCRLCHAPCKEDLRVCVFVRYIGFAYVCFCALYIYIIYIFIYIYYTRVHIYDIHILYIYIYIVYVNYMHACI